MFAQGRSLVRLLDNKVGEGDLQDDGNYELMKSYVVGVLKGTSLPFPQLPTCKEHRVGA